MAKRKRKGGSKRTGNPPPRETPARQAQKARPAPEKRPAREKRPAKDAGARVARIALSAGLAGTALFVDTGADSAFEAPKRLLALILIAVAAAAAFAFSPRFRTAAPPWREGSLSRRLAFFLFLAAVAAAVAAAFLSPRRELALDSTRALLLYALLLPLGASRALRSPKSLLGVFLAVSAVNAVVSLLQASGRFHPFQIKTWGGREATSAFAGNVGVLSVGLALAAVAALAVALAARRLPLRAIAAAAALLFVSGALVNQNLTSLTVLAAGGAALLFLSYGRRSLLPIALHLAALGVGILAFPALRGRVAEAVAAAKSGQWDRLLTYRLGAWAAAAEMTRERPALGFGPGTFGAEFVPHRLKAELRWRKRFLNPLVTSSYAETHCDYLQPFAEAGVLAGSAAAGAAFLLLVALAQAARGMKRESRTEAVLLLAVLIAGAAAALTWFPLQRPITAMPLLLAAGRGWRIAGGEEP